MKPQIYIDFDGTIVDVWARYYAIVKDYFSLTDDYFEIYKQLKYIYPNDSKLVAHAFGLTNDEIEKYLNYKHACLEDIKYLRFDTLLVDCELLSRFFQKTDARILTARKSKEAIMEQLDFLNIGFLRESLIVLSPQGIDTKYNWLREHTSEKPFIMAGDSEVDLKAGKIPFCKTIFIKTGLRSVESIPKDLNAHETYENISDWFNNVFANQMMM